MTDVVTVAVIASLPAFLAAIASIVASLRNGIKLDEVHLQLNGKLEKMIKMREKASFAEGVKSETDKEK